MKARILAVLAAMILIVGVSVGLYVHKARAQNTPQGLTMGTTVTANTYGGQTYFYLLLSGGNVTTFNLTNTNVSGTAVPFNPGVVTIVLQQDGTGSRTVGWGTMFATAVIPTVFATANKTTVMPFFYDSASGLWYPLSTTALHN